ncbi:MAG: hypothetical protein K2L12_08215 [Clostridia bacterium]|nr:hypothetical protein [Clostridia bacterium]
MTLKEYLKQQAQKDVEKLLTENDILICRQLAESVRIANQKKAEQDGKKDNADNSKPLSDK